MPVNLRSTAIVITETPDPEIGTPSRTRRSSNKPQTTPKATQQTPKAASQRTPKPALSSNKQSQRAQKRPYPVEPDSDDEPVKTPRQTRHKKNEPAPEPPVTRRDLAYQLLTCARLAEDDSNAFDIETVQEMVDAVMEALSRSPNHSPAQDGVRPKRQRRTERTNGTDDTEDDLVHKTPRRTPKTQTPRSRRIIPESEDLSDGDTILAPRTPLRTLPPRRPVESTDASLSDAEDIASKPIEAPPTTPKTPLKRTPRAQKQAANRAADEQSEDELSARTPRSARRSGKRTHKKPRQTEVELSEGTEIDAGFYGFGAFERVSRMGREGALLGREEFRVVDVGEVEGGMCGFVAGQVMMMDGVEV